MKSNKQIVLDAVLEEDNMGIVNTNHVYIGKELFYSTETMSNMVIGLVEKHTGISNLSPVMLIDSPDSSFCGLINDKTDYVLPDYMYENEDLIREIHELVLKSTENKYYYRNRVQFDLKWKSICKSNSNDPKRPSKFKWFKWL